MLELLRNKKILVVVAHPDEELLGIGGTINRLVQEYDCLVKVLILGEGITSREPIRNTEKCCLELEQHKKNIFQAKSTIGYQEISIYDFPDNRFDSIDILDIIKIIEKEKQDFKPEIIFTHHGGDLNIDHQRTYDAVVTACRPLENELVKMIVCFETPSCTEWRSSADPKHFTPNMFVELSQGNLQAKLKSMEAYKYEKRNYPHPRSAEALTILAQRWGIVIGRKYAEAFMLIRLIS